ncbi:MAG: alpha/beta fold hydrolase [Actinobacteria bacterium]|nr:alpha/beta fold hydrolase [Actinomycetota bacterium]
MSDPTMVVPWLPEGRAVMLPGRGEVFARVHRHPDPSRPTVLLLHGWTASADLQFFTAYRELCEQYSLVAIDHRGHGRGLRAVVPFELEDAADDAAALVRALGIDHVVTVGYSMGGPISMHLARRHPGLVTGMVVQATALEWRATWAERFRWKTVRLLGPVLRSWAYPRWLRYGIMRLLGAGHELERFIPWIEAEIRRSDTLALVQAGRALSRHDARPWASSLRIPAASLITTQDRLVRPRKQRQLADALHAYVLEMEADHIAVWQAPATYAQLTLALVDHLTGRLEAQQQPPVAGVA